MKLKNMNSQYPVPHDGIDPHTQETRRNSEPHMKSYVRVDVHIVRVGVRFVRVDVRFVRVDVRFCACGRPFCACGRPVRVGRYHRVNTISESRIKKCNLSPQSV